MAYPQAQEGDTQEFQDALFNACSVRPAILFSESYCKVGSLTYSGQVTQGGATNLLGGKKAIMSAKLAGSGHWQNKYASCNTLAILTTAAMGVVAFQPSGATRNAFEVQESRADHLDATESPKTKSFRTVGGAFVVAGSAPESGSCVKFMK